MLVYLQKRGHVLVKGCYDRGQILRLSVGLFVRPRQTNIIYNIGCVQSTVFTLRLGTFRWHQ